MSLSSSSSHHSTMSSGATSEVSVVDLMTYQDDMENVLTWLLEAEETIERQEPLGNTVGKVKEQFNQHEVGSFVISYQPVTKLYYNHFVETKLSPSSIEAHH